MRLVIPISLTLGLISTGCNLVSQLPEVESPAIQENKPIATDGDPIVAAAGDIACDPTSSYYNDGKGNEENCQMKATSDLLIDANLAAVLPLGDIQYEIGTFPAFRKSYDPTWGRVKSITYPAVGNHEYETAKASGYYTYFGTRAGDRAKGYYSYDLGKWHIIVLNSNCSEIGGCDRGSPQEQWLTEDLKKHPNTCTLAYWHHPRFSSGFHGNNNNVDAFWQRLYEADVELVLNGHDHNYERFAPQSPNGELDQEKGIRQFVVGTGGKNHYQFGTIQPNSEVRNSDTFGVLKLTLHPQSYDWQFSPIINQEFTDSGSDSCH